MPGQFSATRLINSVFIENIIIFFIIYKNKIVNIIDRAGFLHFIYLSTKRPFQCQPV